MTATLTLYPNGQKNIMKDVGLTADTLKLTLHSSSYTPSDSHEFYSDLTNELSTGSGYTSGGATLSSKTVTITAANSWGSTWASDTAYVVGDIIRPSTGNGHLYRCIVGGTSGSSEPTWPTTKGQTVNDGSVTWAEVGRSAVVFDAADVTWSSSTLTARYAILRKDTGTGSTSPVIGYMDFGENVSSTNSTFQVAWNASGIYITFIL